MENKTDLNELSTLNLDEFIDRVEELLGDENNLEEIPAYRLDYLGRMFNPDGNGINKEAIIGDDCCGIDLDILESLEKDFREADLILNLHQSKCNYLSYLIQKYESVKDEYFKVWDEKKIALEGFMNLPRTESGKSIEQHSLFDVEDYE
jgi:hypothetical protein